MHFDLLLTHGTVVLPGQTLQTHVGILDGKINAIGDLQGATAERTIDCKGLHVLPGMIDSQVHFREPGAEHKETLEAGLRSAALGGITAVFEMPNTNPLTLHPKDIEDKIERASKHPWVDYAFYIGGAKENAANLHEWENLPSVCGVKVFMGASTGDLLCASDEELEAVLSNGKRVVAIHSEDEYIMQENKKTMLGDNPDVAMHPVWRSVESCVSSTTRLLKAARKYGRRVHVLHITTAQEMELLSQNKDIASVEVLANHLTLSAPTCYEALGSLAQQNPPIRDKEHQDALWAAIADGTVDIVASDHAPHTAEEKALPYPKSPSGTPGVQTLLPIMLHHVNQGKLTLERLVDLMAYGPSRIHQIACKGRIAKGYDGDITIVDMNKRNVISSEDMASVSKWTPFEGMETQGWPIFTIIRGHVVMEKGELSPKPIGQPVRFRETL